MSADAGYNVSRESGRVTVSAPGSDDSLAVSVIDMAGRTVAESEGRGRVTIDVTPLSGIYLLRVSTSGAVSSTKIVL